MFIKNSYPFYYFKKLSLFSVSPLETFKGKTPGNFPLSTIEARISFDMPKHYLLIPFWNLSLRITGSRIGKSWYISLVPEPELLYLWALCSNNRCPNQLRFSNVLRNFPWSGKCTGNFLRARCLQKHTFGVLTLESWGVCARSVLHSSR